MSKTPKLRFKEFSGDWENKKLGSLLEFKNGINASKEQYGHGKKFINVLDILSNDYITYENIIGKVDVDDVTFDKYSVGYGDVVFQRSSETREEVGTANVYLDKKHKATFGGFIIRGKKVGEYNPIFMNKLLKTSSARKEITTKSGGSTRYNVGQETLSDVEVMFPKLEEQEKIASFFSLIDDKISLQGEKVEALKEYKTGMMQKIFSRELRFKDDDGRDYPEWEEKKLNQLGDTYTGLSGKTKENFGIGKAKYVIYKNVFGNTLAKEEEVDLVEINEGENQNKVAKGDLLFTTSSETPEEVGMISCWNYDIDDLYLNSFCFGYRLFDLERYSPIFIAYLLRSEAYRRKISILGQGSTRYNMSKTELMKMKVSVPNIEEQRKIVSLLLGIESKIEKEQEKLDYLNEYKKGLLQQMFI